MNNIDKIEQNIIEENLIIALLKQYWSYNDLNIEFLLDKRLIDLFEDEYILKNWEYIIKDHKQLTKKVKKILKRLYNTNVVIKRRTSVYVWDWNSFYTYWKNFVSVSDYKLNNWLS